MDTNFESIAKKELIDNLLKIMVTPNIKQLKHSDEDDRRFTSFLNSVRSHESATIKLPLDYAIKDEMFQLIKSGKVFIKSSIKFQTEFTTKVPDSISAAKFEATYVGHEFYYSFLDNHPGIINIDKLSDIPIDYEGFMAVPLTVLEFKNIVRFNVYKILYAPRHNGKLIYPRIVVSNKIAITD